MLMIFLTQCLILCPVEVALFTLTTGSVVRGGSSSSSVLLSLAVVKFYNIVSAA